MCSLVKHLVWAICLVMACASSAHGQSHHDGNIAVGGKMGASFSKVNFSPSVPQMLQPGVVIGGTFRYIEERHFGVIVEFNAQQRGWKEDFEGLDFSYNRRFTYLQLPVLTHIFFGNDRFRFFFNAGPEIGYMINSATAANFDIEQYRNIENFPHTNRNCDQFSLKVKNKFDYGISAGAGIEWSKNSKHSLNLEGRFYYGLNDVFGNHKKDVFSSSNSFSVMVTLGYYYRIK